MAPESLLEEFAHIRRCGCRAGCLQIVGQSVFAHRRGLFSAFKGCHSSGEDSQRDPPRPRGELEPHYYLLAVDFTVTADQSYRNEESLAANWSTWACVRNN